MRPRFPQTVPDYYPLGGGLDLLTPAISMPPGKVISSQNYEPETGGGYKRIKGYERFSGKALPSSKSYWLATVALSGTVAVGDTITGVTSTATGVVIAIESATVLVLAQVTGTFQAESITVGTVSSVTAASASDPSNHADYNNLAADNWRAQIAAITGSGAIRGVWYYGGNWYAFRDNAGGTAGDMWKATGSGWTQVTFGTEIQFSSTTGGTTPIAVGDTIGNLTIGAPPTKTATVVKVLHRAGTWGTDAVGTLIITPVLGTFSNADQIWVGATQKAVATTAACVGGAPRLAVRCVLSEVTNHPLNVSGANVIACGPIESLLAILLFVSLILLALLEPTGPNHVPCNWNCSFDIECETFSHINPFLV